MMKYRQNALTLKEKEKEELLLDHEISELKAELKKIESKIKDKKSKFVSGKLRKGANLIAS